MLQTMMSLRASLYFLTISDVLTIVADTHFVSRKLMFSLDFMLRTYFIPIAS